MKLQINGEARDFAELKTLTDLVAALGLEPGMTLVEHNGIAPRRADWPRISLGENDRIEILQVAAGG